MSSEEQRKQRREYMQHWYTKNRGNFTLKTLAERMPNPVDPANPESFVTCAVCGVMFRQITSAHLKLHGLTTTDYKAQGHPLFCQEKLERNAEVIKARSIEMTGPNHPNWKNGHKSKSSGYIYIYRNGVQMYAHRAIMEDLLGRPLAESEQVHHLDGNRANNDPSNLVIIGTAAHTAITATRSHNTWRRLGVMAVRALLAQGWNLNQISSEFHVNIETLLTQLDKHHDSLQDYIITSQNLAKS